MYNDLLNNYSDDDYVYIIEGCLNDYVSFEPDIKETCPICGSWDWPLCDGLVKDIKKSKNMEDLFNIQKEQESFQMKKTKYRKIF